MTPTSAPAKLDAIPAELRARDQWVLWRGEVRDDRLTKVPYRVSEPLVRASSTDPTTWASFEQAVSVVDQADGIGFVFSADDPFVGVDLDEGLSEFDRAAITLALDSYSETSVSGGGVHVILRGSLNGHSRNRKGPFEVYEAGRYFVVTGEHVRGTPATIEDRQAELEAVLAEFLPTVPDSGDENLGSGSRQPVDLDDRELLEKMFASKSAKTIRQLWAGVISGYPSHSEADQALCNYLAFWTNRDPARMDSLFRSSGLMRPKWERQDYRERTIETAIVATPEGYQPKPIPTPEPVSEWVAETASQPAREGSRDGTHSRIPPVGEYGEEWVAVAAPSATSVELVFQSAADFAGEDEPNAEMILGLDDDDAAFVAGGTVVVFGKGGGGKTTLVNDLACHLATGTDWQGLKVPKRRKVGVVEHDGPRGRFRRKIRAKLSAWQGDDPADHLTFLTEPWGKLRFSVVEHRTALAAYLNENEVEMLIAGPIVSLGMIGGGTPDEVAAFEAHLQALRDLLERPLLILLVHHTNQRGQISGAWDRVPDTLMFVVNTGKGTRLVWQKARDSSTLHAASWKLRWADGMAFELDDTPDQTEDDIEEAILAGARENPGASWTTVARGVKGNATTRMDVRDRLIAEGLLVDTRKGQAFALWHPDDVDVDGIQTALDEGG